MLFYIELISTDIKNIMLLFTKKKKKLVYYSYISVSFLEHLEAENTTHVQVLW